MKTAVRYKTLLIAAVVVIIILVVVVLLLVFGGSKQETDPHEGEVYVYDGYDWTWMKPIEGLALNPFSEADFSERNGQIVYTGTGYEVLRGIDVSEHQLEIDWAQVASDDIDFAYIRIGRRGTTEGGVYLDEYYKANIEGALENGLQVGVYFFSQAINVQEAIEEAEFVLDNLDGYEISLPIVFDWEKDERTGGLDSSILNDCAVAFCETVKNAGYEPCVYFGRISGYYSFDLLRLSDYTFWFALPELSWPSFLYTLDIWQYSFTETVPGISVETDMNLMFIPLSVPESEPPKS